MICSVQFTLGLLSCHYPNHQVGIYKESLSYESVSALIILTLRKTLAKSPLFKRTKHSATMTQIYTLLYGNGFMGRE